VNHSTPETQEETLSVTIQKVYKMPAETKQLPNVLTFREEQKICWNPVFEPWPRYSHAQESHRALSSFCVTLGPNEAAVKQLLGVNVSEQHSGCKHLSELFIEHDTIFYLQMDSSRQVT